MPATTPIIEQVVQAVVDRVAMVTTANGYQTTIASVNRPVWAGDFKGDHLAAYVIQGEPAPDDTPDMPNGRCEGNPPLIQWFFPIAILISVRQSETDTAPIHTAINVARADVEKALMTDPTFGGLCLGHTKIGAPEDFADSAGAYAGVSVMLETYFRTSEFNPYVNGIS